MKALQGPGAAPVQRARMSNLVIFCNSLEQAILINAQVPDIEAVHPARVLLLVGEPAAVGVRRDGARDGAADERGRRPCPRLRRAGDAARGRGGGGSAAVRGAGAADRRPADEPVVGGPAAAAVGRAAAVRPVRKRSADHLRQPGLDRPGARRGGDGVVAGPDRAGSPGRPLARGVRPELAAAEILAAAARCRRSTRRRRRARPSR